MSAALPPLPPHVQRLNLGGYAYTADQMQAYATKARADLEAENKRLRDALRKIANWRVRDGSILDGPKEVARTALKEQP